MESMTGLSTFAKREWAFAVVVLAVTGIVGQTAGAQAAPSNAAGRAGGRSILLQAPTNRYLSDSLVKSPDMMNICSGNVVTDANGRAEVVLPNYFEAWNRDFRYQLTVIGRFAQAVVEREIENNRFTIRTNKPGVKVSWQVTGVRHAPEEGTLERSQRPGSKPVMEQPAKTGERKAAAKSQLNAICLPWATADSGVRGSSTPK